MRLYVNIPTALIAGSIWLLPASTAAQQAPPITIGEQTRAQANQLIFAGNSAVVGGLVVVCEQGVNPFPSGPNPILTIGLGGNAGNNYGISDILAFIPAVDLGGGNELFAELASDRDRENDPDIPREYADINGITLNGAPVVFINPPMVGVSEIWGPSGTVEYAPGVGQPGFFVNANGQLPVYQIATDNSGNGSANIPPQTPTSTFDAGGHVSVGPGATPQVPEPSSMVLLGAGTIVGGMVWTGRNRRQRVTG